VGYHRYRGTVGGQAVTVELTIGPRWAGQPPTCAGHYYYEHRGGALALLAPAPFRAGAPLALTETLAIDAEPDDQPATGYWQAQTPAGPVLIGSWTSGDGRRRLPFALREDYAGAIRYEILTASRPNDEDPDGDERAASYHAENLTVEFLHVLGPDSARLRALQCPPPAQRQALVADMTGDSYISVALNGYGLLSLLVLEAEETGGPYPRSHRAIYTYDLSTGRACDPLDWLRPSQQMAFRRLLTRHLLADSIAHDLFTMPGIEGLQAKPPLASLVDFGLNSEGLYCILEEYGVPHVIQGKEITIPYSELRSYVRPGTPLARLLAARYQ